MEPSGDLINGNGYSHGGLAEQLGRQVTALAESRAAVQTITRLPATVNLVTYAGDDLRFALVVTIQGSPPPDLREVQFRSHVRPAPAGELAGEIDCTVDPVQQNMIRLHLPAAVSAVLPARAVWDVEMDDGVNVLTLAAGTVTTTPDVTR